MNHPERPKVLIVDDQPRNLDVLEAMLGDVDYALIRATSADEALLAVVRHEFAALVLDIKMPGMGGLDLAKLIKQRKRSQHVPILFLTAHSFSEDDVLRGYGVGAVDYLSKPVNAEILRSKIGAFVDLFRKTRALADLNAALQHEIAERERAQAALLVANQELERRVLERTAALNRAHQGVRENEERLRMALEVAQIAAWEWHLASGQMRWSTDPEILFGFPKGSFGQELRITRTVHPEDQERVEVATAAALQSGVYETEYRAVHPDGSVVWIKERGRVFSDPDGDRMVGISRDVTADRESALERERLLKSERVARDDAERQSRLKDEFLATLSHELRTPMNIILGWLDTLAKGTPVRDTRSTVAVIQRNAQIQAKLIEDLLDMNRLMAGNLQVTLVPVEVSATLRTTIQGLQPVADAKNIQVNAASDAASVSVLADERRLQQILWNLLHNAIKFTPKGGRVGVRVEQYNGRVNIEVRDNGSGISRDFLPHVFERFRQEDSSSTRESPGLGLGLSIAKQLADLHGGTIRAFSDGTGKGATFTLDLHAAGVSREAAATAGTGDQR
ncbi:MAG TPA: ATP-binding protein [Vicinamibacterales bacterium]